MAQPGDRACLAQEALPRRWRGSEVGGDDLDGDRPVEGDVASEQDLAHATGAELTLDVVPTRERAPEGVQHGGDWGFGHAVGLAGEPSPGTPPLETTQA